MSDTVEKTVTLNAPLDRVWQAISDHEQFGAWFRVAIDGPFVAGQPSTGHMTIPGYEHIRWDVTIVAVEPPRLFSFTWHPYALDPAVDYSAETPTLVEFRLAPDGGGTRLIITESGFDAIPAGRRAEAFRMNGNGWTQQIEQIRAHVGG